MRKAKTNEINESPAADWTPPPGRLEQPESTAKPTAGQDIDSMSLTEALRELTRLDNREDLDTQPRTVQLAHRARRSAVAARAFTLQQPPPAPVIDGNALAGIRSAETRVSENRASLIAKLRAVAGKR